MAKLVLSRTRQETLENAYNNLQQLSTIGKQENKETKNDHQKIKTTQLKN